MQFFVRQRHYEPRDYTPAEFRAYCAKMRAAAGDAIPYINTDTATPGELETWFNKAFKALGATARITLVR